MERMPTIRSTLIVDAPSPRINEAFGIFARLMVLNDRGFVRARLDTSCSELRESMVFSSIALIDDRDLSSAKSMEMTFDVGNSSCTA